LLVDLQATLNSSAVRSLGGPLQVGPKVAVDHWNQLSPETLQPATSRKLTVQVKDGQLHAEYILELPKEHPILRSVQDGRAEQNPRQFVDLILGKVEVGEYPVGFPQSSNRREVELLFEAPRVTLPTGASTAEVHLTSRPYWFALRRFDVIVNPALFRAVRNPVVVETRRAAVLAYGDSRPWSQEETNTGYARPANTPLRFAVQSLTSNTLRARLLRIGSFDWLAVGELVVNLLWTLPSALVLWLLYRVAATSGIDTRVLAELVALVVSFRLGVAILDAYVDASFGLGHHMQRLGEWLLKPNAAENVTGAGAFGVVFVSILLLWPLRVARVGRLNPGAMHGRNRRITLRYALLWLVLVVGAYIGMVWAVENAGGPRDLDRLNVVVAIQILILASLPICSYLLARMTTRTQRPWSVGAVTTLALVATATLAWALVYRDPARTSLLHLSVFLVGAMVMTLTFAILLLRVSRMALGPIWEKRKVAFRIGVAVALIIAVVVPTVDLIIPPTRSADTGPWTLFSTGYGLVAVGEFVVLACLLLFLRSLAQSAEVRPHLTRRAGIVFVLITFFSATDRWLYLPVSFLVGWFMAAVLLLPERRTRLVAAIKATRPPIRPRALFDQVLRISKAEEAIRAKRNQLNDELGKDKSETEYHQQLQPLERDYRNLIWGLPVRVTGKSPKQVAFGLVRTGSAWRAGVRGAGYGALLGLPWLAQFIWELGTDPFWVSDGPYAILDFLAWPAWLIAQWTLYGFFFGYFYPYIRGDNGIQKGLCLFVTLTVPVLAYHGLSTPWHSDWLAFGLWAVQVFIFCMLLGLFAGDLETLRRMGLERRRLIELHRLRFLVTFASSLVLAGGVTLATWISTGATIYSLIQGQDTGGPPTPPAAK
jgi:hypothetical protein